MKLEKYNKELEFSYTFGAFPTFELVKNRAKDVLKIIFHSKLKISEEIDNLIQLCKQKNIPIEYDDKAINRVADKENVFVLGVFKKYENKLASGNNLVLVNPSDMGNLGTIMRSMLGFGIQNLIIIKPAVDYFNPKVIRASMGAIFSLNIAELESAEEYLKTKTKKYCFMLDGKNELGKFKFSFPCDLVFGNEASGLPHEFLSSGESVVIRHSKKIDSLNLPISVGIALYQFNNQMSPERNMSF